MKREQFLPVDLGHLQDKARSIQHALEVYMNHERSEKMRQFYLRKALHIAGVIVHDIDYLDDTKTFGGTNAFGIED